MGEDLNYNYYCEPPVPHKKDDCEVTATNQIPLVDEYTSIITGPAFVRRLKVPVVLVERTIQIVVEADVPLNPPATEIKRVKKHVFLDQVKLIPVRFARIDNTDFFTVTRAKLFISGHIRKNIEYASAECNGALQDRIANVPFSGFTELTNRDFLLPQLWVFLKVPKLISLTKKQNLTLAWTNISFKILLNTMSSHTVN